MKKVNRIYKSLSSNGDMRYYNLDTICKYYKNIPHRLLHLKELNTVDSSGIIIFRKDINDKFLENMKIFLKEYINL